MNPLAIFAGPWGLAAKWGVIALLVAAFGGWSWMKGNAHGTQKLLDYQAQQATEAVRIARVRDKVTTQVVTKYVQRAAETKVVTEYIEKEVVRYADTNPGYCLDARWRGLHDAAAANAVPGAAGRADDPGGAPKAAEAIDAVSANYAACHRTADRLDALQDWVRRQEAVR